MSARRIWTLPGCGGWPSGCPPKIPDLKNDIMTIAMSPGMAYRVASNMNAATAIAATSSQPLMPVFCPALDSMPVLAAQSPIAEMSIVCSANWMSPPSQSTSSRSCRFVPFAFLEQAVRNDCVLSRMVSIMRSLARLFCAFATLKSCTPSVSAVCLSVV